MCKRIFVLYVGILFSVKIFAQAQPCPANINFGDGTLTDWDAYVGMSINSRNNIQKTDYSSKQSAPNGTIGVKSFDEVFGNNGSGSPAAGITVNSVISTDYFGGFPTIPNINGYQYTNSVKLGSTTVWGSSGKGLIRGVSYTITVPVGSATVPYTMTYAYAMVLENGSHQNDQQPLAKATLTKPDGTIIACASPSYYLPTLSQGPQQLTIDSVTAIRNGFAKSSKPSPNIIDREDLYRVWYKPWTEVTFDLSAYRGQQVVLTFEADNCVPGGHFAYAYFALRNECNGLQITGPQAACINTPATYSVPALPGSTTYQWSYPSGWNGKDSANFLYVTPNSQSGTIQVKQFNSCDTLSSILNVNVGLPTIAGNVTGSDSVCTGINSSSLSLTGNTGNVLKWLSSTDGINWTEIQSTDSSYTASNLTQTTRFKTIVQNGSACLADSSGTAIVQVDALSVAGSITPNILNVCAGQSQNNNLVLQGNTGNVVNWLYSYDTANWVPQSPANTSTVQPVDVTAFTQYRTIVKSGVCPADTSGIAYTAIYNISFPQATVLPADTSICYGDSANLSANVTIGTSYSWVNSAALIGANSGNIPPNNFNVTVHPPQTYKYVVEFINDGCPNGLYDTVTVNVVPEIKLSAGNDTVVVANQPLQLTAVTDDSEVLNYEWTPITGLDNPFVYNPIATLPIIENDTIIYAVKATDAIGCFAQDSVRVVVFRTAPDIFVPSGFTPNGDGTNDILRAIPVGIKTFEFLNIYNRYGQLLFTTPNPENGWDGNYNGYRQPSGTYVYMARGISYLGTPILKKGTVVLIR